MQPLFPHSTLIQLYNNKVSDTFLRYNAVLKTQMMQPADTKFYLKMLKVEHGST